jgi:hypothetical protein
MTNSRDRENGGLEMDRPQGYAPDPVCENNLSFRNYADYAMTALASPL